MANCSLKGYYECIDGYKMPKFVNNFEWKFLLFHFQLTSPILPFKTHHKPGVGGACGLISLNIFFSSSTTLIMALWTTSYRSSSNFNFLSPLSKTFSAFDGIPLGKFIFFLLAKVMQVGADEKGHNLSHLLAKEKP